MKNQESRLFDITWIVNEGGYEISRANMPKDSTIREMIFSDYRAVDLIVPCKDKWKKYNPFESGLGIAKEFSCIPFDLKTKQIDESAAIQFANRYGLLGLNHSNGKGGEPLNEWADMIILFWEIFNLIDKNLHEAARTVFNNFGPKPQLKLSISTGDRKWLRSLEITPTSLYGAMWIMVANAITKGTQLQECKMLGCGKWVPIRSNKKYCSDACKQSFYRSQLK